MPAVPKAAVADRLAVVGDFLRPCSEFELRRILRDCTTEIDRVRDWSLVGRLHGCIGLARWRLGDFEGAAEAFRKQVQFPGDATASRVNLAGSLMLLGRPREALEILVELEEDGSHLDLLIHSNAAEAFWRLGDFENARTSFRAAVELANPEDAQSFFILAQQAAEMEASWVALVNLANAFAVREQRPIDAPIATYLDSISEAAQRVLAEPANARLKLVFDLRHTLVALKEAESSPAVPSDDPRAETAEDVLKATTGWRAKALLVRELEDEA